MSTLLLVWPLPGKYWLRKLLHQTLGKYVYWAGLDTYWGLFAPDPISKNYLIGFEIELTDGTVIPWRLQEYTIRNDYQWTPHFRYVKMHDQLLSQKDPIPKESISKYIIQEYLKQGIAHSSPSRVFIIQYYEPPDDKLWHLLPWLSRTVFIYEVKPNKHKETETL